MPRIADSEDPLYVGCLLKVWKMHCLIYVPGVFGKGDR